MLFIVAMGFGMGAVAALAWQAPEQAQLAQAAPAPLAAPPEGQTFVGAKNCSACHFDQYLDWRTTKHAKGFDILPAQYKTDQSCLKCHTTGLGAEGGFKTLAATPDLVGASCEACHGPGSKHAEIAKGFGDKKLSEAEEKYVRSTIHKMQPKNVCVECHLTRAHQKHPTYVGMPKK
jgi:mono/diheme cytochrome c family protein